MAKRIGNGGHWGQTIRIKPPFCLALAEADFFLEILDDAFTKLAD